MRNRRTGAGLTARRTFPAGFRALLALGLALGLAVPADAVSTRFVEISTIKDCEHAVLNGVKISSLGEVSLGLATRALKGGEKELWASLVGKDGKIYFTTGSSAALWRIDDQTPTRVFSTDDLAFSCLAQGADGTIFVGSIPQGRVYAVDPSGKGRQLVALPTPYVWSLLVGPDGSLYAGTGPDGLVYRISGKGEAKIHYDTREGNVLSLAFSPKGELYAGTAQKGLVYRIARPDSAEVVADFKGREVKCLQFHRETLYLATNETRTKLASPEKESTRTSIEFQNLGRSLAARFSGEEVNQEGSEVATEQSMLRRYDLSASATVERILPDRRVENLFNLDDGAIMDLKVDGSGTVLVATGKGGRVFAVRPLEQYELLLTLEEGQAVTLALVSDRLAFVGCANPARPVLVLPERPRQGMVTLKPTDCGLRSRFGEARWEGEGAAKISARSGNTSAPDHTWSPWTGPRGPSPVRLDVPDGRQVQVRLQLEGAADLVRTLRLSFLNQNQRPAMESLTVGSARPGSQRDGDDKDGDGQASGSADLKRLSDAVPGSPSKGQPDKDQSRKGRDRRSPGFDPFRPRTPIREIRWKASDADGDVLVYRLFARPRADALWLPLNPKEPATGSSFSWNTESVPDGTYVAKIVGSDERSNPPGEELSGEKISTPFVIDNTPPVVTLTVDGAARVIRVAVVDTLSTVRAVEHSVDGQEWKPLFPKDRLLDSLNEELELSTSGLSPGPHAIVVRSADTDGNVGAARIVVSVDKR
ncbi:MAG: hypothetical protein HY815_32335 [Candidatus Riflebacteria bacterium]|nr:hypothetical protein [Candidatus Riflebacteria bacterium]